MAWARVTRSASTAASHGESSLDHRLFFYEVVWTNFAQILGAIEAIEIKDTIEMIDLVLQCPGKQAFRADPHGLAAQILPFHQNGGRSPDVHAIIAGNAQAGIDATLLSLGLDNFGVGHGHLEMLVRFSIRAFDDKETQSESNLCVVT